MRTIPVKINKAGIIQISNKLSRFFFLIFRIFNWNCDCVILENLFHVAFFSLLTFESK